MRKSPYRKRLALEYARFLADADALGVPKEHAYRQASRERRKGLEKAREAYRLESKMVKARANYTPVKYGSKRYRPAVRDYRACRSVYSPAVKPRDWRVGLGSAAVAGLEGLFALYDDID